MVVVNSALIMTYYEIGTIINQRKQWGNKYIERLSNDLKEYGKGYSTQNLYRMSQVAKEFSKDELFSQPARIIPWFTLIEILHKSKSHKGNIIGIVVGVVFVASAATIIIVIKKKKLGNKN